MGSKMVSLLRVFGLLSLFGGGLIALALSRALDAGQNINQGYMPGPMTEAVVWTGIITSISGGLMWFTVFWATAEILSKVRSLSERESRRIKMEPAFVG